MPGPEASLSTLRPDLGASFAEFDLEMQRRGYIANQVLPVFNAPKQTGSFGVLPIEQLLKDGETQRAPGSGYSRGDWTFQTQTYTCNEHGWEEPVDDRESQMYADYFDAEQVSAMRAFEQVLRAQEQRVADAVFNTSTWTATSVTNEWDDATNATPITDVENAVQTVYDATGVWPNALIINRKVFRNLRLCSQIIDRFKSQGFVDVRASQINEAMMASIFDLDRIIVGGTTKNTANEGAAASLSPVWSDEYAMITKVATSNDIRETCLGRTFHWSEDGSQPGGTIETYRDETVRGDVVRVRHDVDEKIIYSTVGELLDNITT
tara:strand:+ start:3629 stop:4594 length:966 start_codon:yes stop_codon:yes gene_type:complete